LINQTKVGKLFLKVVLQFVLILLIIEVSLRVIFFQKKGREHFATIEQLKNIKRSFFDKGASALYQQYYLARPDSGKEANQKIAKEVIESNKFEYSPWVEYKNIDFSGEYINTKGLVRKTSPEQYVSKVDSKVYKIYFIGGSTMYGLNVTDKETIPSFFVDEYRKAYPEGQSIHVYNFGICAYHSYSELMLLSHLIHTGHKPDMIVVFDGLNDFFMPTASIEKWPYIYYRLRLASDDNINYRKMALVVDSTKRLFDPSFSPVEPNQLSDTLMKNYSRNIAMMKHLANTNAIEAFFFIQPTPFYNYPNKSKDPICHAGTSDVLEKAYPILEKECDTLKQQYFLGSFLEKETGYPFIDQFHYSPHINRKIARSFVEVIGAKINK
jgi:hypothetical protein